MLDGLDTIVGQDMKMVQKMQKMMRFQDSGEEVNPYN